MNLNAMLIFIVFISLFITYYLVQRQKNIPVQPVWQQHRAGAHRYLLRRKPV